MSESKTPRSDKCDAEWTKWLQDTWDGTKDVQRDTAPMTPIECARTLETELAAAREAIIAMAEDGWLYHGFEGMSEAQEKCLAAYLLIKPPAPAISDKQGGAT